MKPLTKNLKKAIPTMKNDTNMDDERAALVRLMGESPVPTADGFRESLLWLLSRVRQELQAHPGGKQEWVRLRDIMTRYGVTQRQALEWMVRLRAAGKVRMQTPISGVHGYGDTFYSIADIEAAYRENAAKRWGK